jgi:16S rRNA processing protein RimM
MAAKQTASGSPNGEPEYLVIGFLRRPHGVQGEIIMDLHTDFPERLRSGRKLFIGEKHKPISLIGVRPHQSGMLMKFKGINSPESAGQYRNQWVYVRTRDVPALPDGRMYQHQLLGFRIVDEQNQPLGVLAEIIETGANDVYVVRDETSRELLLPAIPSVILEVDPSRRCMRVHLLDGL